MSHLQVDAEFFFSLSSHLSRRGSNEFVCIVCDRVDWILISSLSRSFFSSSIARFYISEQKERE